MKYDIIKTDNYLIIADDSEIKEGDLCIANGATYNNAIVKYMKSPCPPPYVSNLLILKKIIAHLPLNNSPVLEGIDILPTLTVEDDTPKLSEEYYGFEFIDGFESGFKAAKEKYKWTDEDVIKIVEKSRETGLTAEYLLLSLSQPKYPITFECEMEEVIIGGFIDGKDEAVTLEKENKPKTTSNSQGQTILVGKYIY